MESVNFRSGLHWLQKWTSVDARIPSIYRLSVRNVNYLDRRLVDLSTTSTKNRLCPAFPSFLRETGDIIVCSCEDREKCLVPKPTPEKQKQTKNRPFYCMKSLQKTPSVSLSAQSYCKFGNSMSGYPDKSVSGLPPF